MQFKEFGKKDHLPVMLMHGMMQKWASVYEPLKILEDKYRLIVPAMDGFYDGSNDFTSFNDQCAQIEDFISKNYGGYLRGVYGISQGATLMSLLLTRDRVKVDKAVLDGIYVAHQGKISGKLVTRMFISMKRNGGKPPKTMDIMMRLMGTNKKAYEKMTDMLYWNASDESIKRNFMENYTYHASPDIANSNAEIHLWCGRKEPYAKKSHKILMKYKNNCIEKIFDGIGHGELLMYQSDQICKMLFNIFT